MTQLSLFQAGMICQRWTRGRDRYRPAHETIDPRDYAVDFVKHSDARAFIEREHYSKSWPASILALGLYQKRGVNPSALCGVIVFGVPASQAVIPRWTGLDAAQGADISRLVLEEAVPGNGESFFVSRAIKIFHREKPHIQALCSMSDPLPRTTSEGEVRKNGHIGTVYCALNARYGGRSTPRTIYMARDGSVISDRTLSKLRTDDKGARYTYEILRSHGAPAINAGEASADYVRRALADRALFRKVRHPGNHVYVFACGDRDQRAQLRKRLGPGLPYPRHDFDHTSSQVRAVEPR